MTIDKAIEILEDLQTTLPQKSPEERRLAVKLGIEALKRIQKGRTTGALGVSRLLPGETPEGEK